ncbi:MAG: methyltransferase domain-containing protein [Proteobacteria bacterium]|nr:methyltransferase domain-containing protein [Pseudomonadota bacterium]MBU1584009.1 methyltransferase domain-containing protein [Pseudomonadota bacterium]MBU2630907.1 methyltransferase domain-containing protein [Pseudomonadota bacterium]
MIDGIPVIVADIREYINHSSFCVMKRNDYSENMESLLGDCMGPGSMFDSIRQYLSTYGFDHYGDLDVREPEPSNVIPGSVLGLLSESLEKITTPVNGPIIDLGCSVGRTSFELSKKFNTSVIGIDLNFSMLQAAANVIETGRFTYPKRTEGIAYDKKIIETDFKDNNDVDFWVCDGLNLPFFDSLFSFGLSLNLLDCVGSPYLHLQEFARVLKQGANAIISTPYDWSPSAVPVENWLGGHSQRSESKGRSETMLRSLFSRGGHPDAIETLELIFEKQNLPWTVRIHNRSVMNYSVHVMGLKKLMVE